MKELVAFIRPHALVCTVMGHTDAHKYFAKFIQCPTNMRVGVVVGVGVDVGDEDLCFVLFVLLFLRSDSLNKYMIHFSKNRKKLWFQTR